MNAKSDAPSLLLSETVGDKSVWVNPEAVLERDSKEEILKDAFRSRRPIDIIAKTNPIVIIDEPQSVEGTQTKERLKEFHPLMTLRYSATHKSDSIYNIPSI